jgi:hypothetical protein
LSLIDDFYLTNHWLGFVALNGFYNFADKEGEGHLGLWSKNYEMNGSTDWSVELSRG